MRANCVTSVTKLTALEITGTTHIQMESIPYINTVCIQFVQLSNSSKLSNLSNWVTHLASHFTLLYTESNLSNLSRSSNFTPSFCNINLINVTKISA
jgi:hypothetical protein